MTVKRFFTRALAGCLSLAACVAITACATFDAAPGAAQVAAIKDACAVDAGLRPTVQALSFLATPDEQKALQVAEAGIDTVCANPSGSIQANTLAIFSENTAQIVNIVAQLKDRQRRASAPPPPPVAAAAPASK